MISAMSSIDLWAGQLLDPPAEIEADAERAADHERAEQQQIPAADFAARILKWSCMQVRDG